MKSRQMHFKLCMRHRLCLYISGLKPISKMPHLGPRSLLFSIFATLLMILLGERAGRGPISTPTKRFTRKEKKSIEELNFSKSSKKLTKVSHEAEEEGPSRRPFLACQSLGFSTPARLSTHHCAVGRSFGSACHAEDTMGRKQAGSSSTMGRGS